MAPQLHALILADQPAPGDTPAQPQAPPWFGFTPILLIMVAFVFLMILPRRRQEKQQRAMLSALKRNDKVLNSGGIIGVVESVKETEDEVVLRGGLRVTKSSIVRILNPDDVGKEAK